MDVKIEEPEADSAAGLRMPDKDKLPMITPDLYLVTRLARREADVEEDQDEIIEVLDYDEDALPVIEEGEEEEPTSDDEEDVDYDGSPCEGLCTFCVRPVVVLRARCCIGRDWTGHHLWIPWAHSPEGMFVPPPESVDPRAAQHICQDCRRFFAWLPCPNWCSRCLTIPNHDVSICGMHEYHTELQLPRLVPQPWPHLCVACNGALIAGAVW
jgi:hypothetical protein